MSQASKRIPLAALQRLHTSTRLSHFCLPVFLVLWHGANLNAHTVQVICGVLVPPTFLPEPAFAEVGSHSATFGQHFSLAVTF